MWYRCDELTIDDDIYVVECDTGRIDSHEEVSTFVRWFFNHTRLHNVSDGETQLIATVCVGGASDATG